MTDVWYYALNEKPVGPLSKTQLIDALSRTSRADNALVWRSDFLDWRKASELSELLPYIAKPPPLPRTPPPLPTDLTASRMMSEPWSRSMPSPTGPVVVPTEDWRHPSEGPTRTNIIAALFGFRGRLNRTQYALLFFIGYLLPLVLFYVLDNQMHVTDTNFGVLLYLLPFLLLWVFFALVAKRLHDIDQPGSWSLLTLIPIVGQATLIAMFFARGTPEANQYGPPT
jgi:uncharacterized membrane protein YhaH (DUF805 family)